MYAHDIGKMAEEPQGAAETTPKLWASSTCNIGLITGCDGKNDAKCFFTPIGPIV